MVVITPQIGTDRISIRQSRINLGAMSTINMVKMILMKRKMRMKRMKI